MSKVESSPQKNGSSTFQKVLDVIEFVGNKFPSPFILFSLLGLAVLIISAIFDGASGTYIGKGGKLVEVKILSLLNADGFRYILKQPHFFRPFPYPSISYATALPIFASSLLQRIFLRE